MRRTVSVALLAVFVMTFAVGVMVSTAEAEDPCIATCLWGYYLICCPDGQGGWDCFWGGPCDWGPMP